MSVNIMNKEQLKYLAQKINEKLSDKVDKEEGKGLSTNDYDNDAVTEVAKVANKVDKEDGKGLSTNDYSNDAVTEVAKVANKANANNPTFTGIVTVPTAVTGTNDGTIASTQFVNTAITNTFGRITSFEYYIPEDGALPATGKKGYIYLIPNNGNIPNIYDEYIWANGKFELFGTTEMDLSGYLQKEDKLTATDVDNAFAAAGFDN